MAWDTDYRSNSGDYYYPRLQKSAPVLQGTEEVTTHATKKAAENPPTQNHEDGIHFKSNL